MNLINPNNEIIVNVILHKKIISLVIKIINWSFLIKELRIAGINNKELINEQKNKIPTKVIIGFIEITDLESYSEFKLESELKIPWEVEFTPTPKKNKNIQVIIL